MAPLISFENVSKRFLDGGRDLIVLDRVSLSIEPGQAVGVYGQRRSGKSTLLRMAAGIVLADSGVVRFDEEDVASMNASARGRLLRSDVAFMAAQDWSAMPGETVVNHVAMSLGSEGLTMRQARRRALQALDQVGMGGADAQEAASDLSMADRTRLMLARALARKPRLLVLDEPALMPSIRDRERFIELLREAVRRRGMALLVASEEIGALRGVDVLMSIAEGELSSSNGPGTVVNLPGRRRAAGGHQAG